MSGLQKSKCDSVRTSSKNHHTTTAAVLSAAAVNKTIGSLGNSSLSTKNGQATLNIREARTIPTSPDRRVLLLHNSYNQPSKKSINNT